MKTAISIPDHLFAVAEQEAKQMGISRSEFFSMAVKFYLESQKDELITERLDKIYGESPKNLDGVLSRMQFFSLPVEEW